MLNIEVRVLSRNVDAQLSAIEKRLNALGRTTTGGGGVGSTGFIDAAIGKVDKAFSAIEKFGQRLQSAGRQLTNTFTLPIAIAGGFAIKFAMDNERAGVALQRAYQGPLKDIPLLREGLRSLSDMLGINQADIINIGAAWAAAGAQGSALLKMTQLTGQVMLLSGASADEATKGLITLRQAWGLTAEQMKSAVATLNLVADTTTVKLSDLFDSMTKGAGTARTTGVDMRHYAAMVAELVPTAGGASNAGSTLSRILEKLFTPTKASAEVMKLFGINVLDASYQALNGSQRLEVLAKKFKDLNPAQQAFIGAQAASKIQVNSLDTLLRGINDPLSAYNKTLNETVNGQKALAKMTSDLNAILSSNPQRFQIIKTQLENTLASAIMPLLPALFSLLQMIQQLAQGFANLSPSTQKQILFWLGFLAVLGPVVRLIGGLIVVLGGLGKALLFPIKMLDSLMKNLGTKGLFDGLIRGFGALGSMIGSALEAGFAAASTGVQIVLGRAAALWQNVLLRTEPMFARVGMILSSAFEAAFAAVQAFMQTVAAGALAVWEGTKTAWAAMGAFVASAFEVGFTAVVAAMTAIGEAASTAFEVALAIGAAIGPEVLIGALIVGAVALLVSFRSQVVSVLTSIWDWMVNSARTAIQDIISFFGRLPQYIGDALMGVLKVVMAIGKSIYQGLNDFLNPFQRHSPSLVDLVIAGVDIISAKYKSLGDLGASFRSAVSDIGQFKDAIAGLVNAQRDASRAKIITSLQKNAPGAVGPAQAAFAIQDTLQADLDRVTAAYGRQALVVAKWQAALDASQATLDRQNAKLREMQAVADEMSSRLNLAQQRLSTWSNMPITGMQKMGDAIFNNDQKVKGLQLRLLKLQEAAGNIADIRGQLDLLTGERNALRMKGAGSDVLGPLNDEINKITGSGSGLHSAIDQMVALQNEITKLQNKGQELTLEQSLQFDPLTRQIQKASSAMKEMPFSVILAHVKAQRAIVSELTGEYDKQNARIKEQESIIKRSQNAHDALQHTFDIENKKLTALGDEYDTIQAVISAIGQAAQTAASATSDFNSALAGAAGAGNFKTPGLDTSKLLDPQALQKLVDQYQKAAQKSFGKVNISDLFTKPFKDAWDGLKGFMGSVFVGIGNWELQIWHDLTSAPSVALGGDNFFLTKWIKSGFDYVTGWWDNTVAPWFGNIGSDVATWLGKIPGDLAQWAIDLGNIIIAPFKWAWDKLLGHSIIPDIVNGIEKWFKRLPGKIVNAIGRLGPLLANWASSGATWMRNHLDDAFSNVFTWFANLPSKIMGSVTSIFKFGTALNNWVFSAVVGLYRNLPNIFKGIFDWFSNLGGTIGSKIGDMSQVLVHAGEDLIRGLYKGIKNVVGSIGGAIGKLPVIGGPLKSIFDTVTTWPFAEGGVASPTAGGISARIAEAGRPELVAPLPNGFSMMRLTNTMTRLERFVDQQGNATTMQPVGKQHTVIINGDLSFPNLHKGEDAEKLIRNLEALV